MNIKKNDWIPQKVIREVKNKGGSLEQLSIELGLKPDTVRNALYQHIPRYEKAISNFLGIPAYDIWPSRFKNK